MPPKPRLSDPANGSDNVLEVARTKRNELRKSERKVADLVLADPAPHPQRHGGGDGGMGGRQPAHRHPFLRRRRLPGLPGLQAAAGPQPGARHARHAFGPPRHRPAGGGRGKDLRLHDHQPRLGAPASGRRRSAGPSPCSRRPQRIEFFGFGASGIVARDAQQKFPLFGVPCGAQHDSHQQIMVGLDAAAGRRAVVISNTAATRSIIEVARLARERGAASSALSA